MSGGKKAPSGYQPTGQAQADQQLQGYMGQIGSGSAGLINTAVPASYQLYNTTATNPFAGSFVSGAQGAGTALTGVGQTALGNATALSGLGNQLAGLSPGLIQSGFDPQSALYNQQTQKLTDQQNAINAMYGLASSPYGAAETGQQLEQFNLDWQNQAQARQAAAVNALASLGTSMGNAFSGAQSLGQAGAGDLLSGAQIPYAAQSQVNQDQWSQLANLISSITGAYGLATTGAGLDNSYLHTGQSATQLAQNATAANNATQQQNALNAAGTIGSLAEIFGLG